MWSSKGMNWAFGSGLWTLGLAESHILFRSHVGEQDYVADGFAVGQQHHQSIDADALASGRRQSVLEGAHVILVHRVRFLVAARLLRELLLEAPALLDR